MSDAQSGLIQGKLCWPAVSYVAHPSTEGALITITIQLQQHLTDRELSSIAGCCALSVTERLREHSTFRASLKPSE